MITGEDLIAALPHATDLEGLRDAVSREYVIRKVMTETGEDRQTVIDTMGAIDSMNQEAVLGLTSGAPTTLADGLQAYIETLDLSREQSNSIPAADVIDALHALLMYPWPGEDAFPPIPIDTLQS
jgi:hypothetical protein